MDETRRELRALYGSEKDIAIAFTKKARRTTAATRSGGRRVFQLSALGMGRLRKRVSARKVAEAARSHSQVFHLAAKRCNEFERLPSGRLRFLFVPTLVCYAFSIEIGLKALALYEKGKAPRNEHDQAVRIGPRSCPKGIRGMAVHLRNRLATVRRRHPSGPEGVPVSR